MSNIWLKCGVGTKSETQRKPCVSILSSLIAANREAIIEVDTVAPLANHSPRYVGVDPK